MTPELEIMIQRYREDAGRLTQRELAEREQALWEKILALKLRGNRHRGDLLQELAGVSSYQASQRLSLLQGGHVAEELWRRVEAKEMALRTASELLLQAKRIAFTKGSEIAVELGNAIHRYDKLPFVVQLPDGSFLRKARPRKKGVAARRARAQTPRISTKKLLGEDGGDEGFWSSVRRQTLGFLDSKLKSTDPVFKEQLVREFDVALRQLTNEFRSKVRSAASRDQVWAKVGRITKDEVAKACAVLHVDPPFEGAEADLVQANRMKRKLLRAYHPDAHGGNDITRPQYEAVLRAYELLEKYNEQLRHPEEQTPTAETEAKTDADQRDDGGAHGAD